MAVSPRSKVFVIALAASALGVAAFACSDGSSSVSEFGDAVVDAGSPLGDADVPDVFGLPCQQESDCLGVGNCGYLIAEGCDASGTCIPKLNGGPGGGIEVCGCDGGVAGEALDWYGDLSHATAPVDLTGYCAVREPPADAAADAD